MIPAIRNWAVALGLAVTAMPVRAAVEILVTIEGVKQGQFRGDGVSRAQSNSIEVFAVTEGLQVPFDASTGRVSGRRQYDPVVVTKRIDPASIQILEAAVTNERLKTVTIRFLHTQRTGAESVVHTIKLSNATITSVKTHVDVKNLPASNEIGYEDVAFSFEKIEVTDGGLDVIDEVQLLP